MLTRMWRRSKRPVIGLDIGPSSVKAIAIEQAEDQFKVVAYGEAALTPQCLTPKEVKDSAVLVRAIQSACSSLPKKSFRVIMALSDDAVISKTIPIYSLRADDEIMAQVFLAASQAIAYPAADLYCDYQIIPSSSPDRLVTFVAARAQTIAAYHQAVSDAGFKLSVIDVESQVLAQTYHYFMPKNISASSVMAVLNIGLHRSLFVIINKTTTIYVRAETFSDEYITKKIFELNPSLSMVSELKHNNFLQDCQSETIGLFFQVLGQQLKRHIQFFAMTNEYQPIQQILITSDCVTPEGISTFLSQEIKLPIVELNTFVNFNLPAQLDSSMLLQRASSWLFPCALAIRGIIA